MNRCIVAALCVAALASASPGATKPSDDPPKLFPVQLKRKWGFIDETGKVVIERKYTKVGTPSEGRVLFRLDGHGEFGYLDFEGNVAIPAKFAQAGDFSEGVAWVVEQGAVPRTGPWKKEHAQLDMRSNGFHPGVINTKGKYVMRGRFPQMGTPFKGGVSILKDNVPAQVLVVDRRGRMRGKAQHVFEVKPFSGGMAAVRIRRNYTFSSDGSYQYSAKINRFGYISNQGRLTNVRYYSAGDYKEGLACVRLRGETIYGYVNVRGRMMIKPRFQYGEAFSEGRAAVVVDGEKPVPTEPKKSKWAYVDKAGRQVLGPFDVYRAGPFSEGLAVLQTTSEADARMRRLLGTCRAIDTKGETVFELPKCVMHPFRGGLARVDDYTSEWGICMIGYVNTKGEWVHKPER